MNEKIIEISNDKHNFDLKIFEGPLDLLLHLAKTQKIEISEVSIETLIDQYISYINVVEKKGINIASEYIEMAAELLRLKSKMLLPNINDDYLDELEEYGITKEELINKLVEYKKYKEVSFTFKDYVIKNQGSYYKSRDSLNEYRDENFKDNLDINQLKNAIERVIYRQFEKKSETRTMTVKELEVENMINRYKALMAKIKFSQFIKEMNITEMLSSFLALLESMKLQYIKVEILENDILIIPNDGKGE